MKIILNNLDNYEKSPSYYAYKSKKKYIKYFNSLILNKLNKPKEEDLIPQKKLIKVNSIKRLKEIINESKTIYKIEIDSQKTQEENIHLNFLKYKDFDTLKTPIVFNELIILQMNNLSNLKDISALSACSFPCF